jgi:hypothetical protein
MSTRPERQIATIDAAWDAVQSGDRDRVRAMAAERVHPECEWTPLLSGVDGRTYHGPAGMAEFFEEWLDSFVPVYEDREFTQLDDDTVLARCRLKIEGRESGVAMDREVALIAEFEGDLLRRGRVYDSRAEAMEAADA